MGAGTDSASGGSQEEQFITRAGDLRPRGNGRQKKRPKESLRHDNERMQILRNACEVS